MNSNNLRINAMISRIKEHPVVLALVFLGTVVIALSTFTDAVKNLMKEVTSSSSPLSPEMAREELSRLSLPYTAEKFVEVAQRGDALATRLFLTAGMDPNEKNHKKETALDEAVSAARTEIVHMLVNAKANVTSWHLSEAAILEKEDILNHLLAGGPSHDAINEAFTVAADRGLRKNMDILLKNGADLNVVGAEALLLAAGSPMKRPHWRYSKAVSETRKYETVVYLLEHGVDVNTRNENGWTPLHFAARSGSSVVVRTLLERGAEVDARVGVGSNERGWTALMIALYRYNDMPSNNESAEIVKALLAKGADVNVSGQDGKTALMLAANSRDARIVQLLLEAGARVKDMDRGGERPGIS